LFPNRDNALIFEEYVAEIWLLLLKRIRVELRIHREGPKDTKRFEKMLRRNIHLSPDVILAAMPKLASSIIDPYTNHEKVSWVMNGTVQQPIGLHMVKPFSKIRGFHKQMGEVLRAVMELEGNVLHGTEREHAGIPSELEGDEVQCKEQDQAGMPPEGGSTSHPTTPSLNPFTGRARAERLQGTGRVD
jgi:hypothetical protein